MVEKRPGHECEAVISTLKNKAHAAPSHAVQDNDSCGRMRRAQARNAKANTTGSIASPQ